MEKNGTNLGGETGRIRVLSVVSEPVRVWKGTEECKALKWVFFQSRDMVKIIAQPEWVI
jgi:hypothetical protein